MDTGAAADKAPTSSSGKSAERVSFSASGTGTRGALFEGKGLSQSPRSASLIAHTRPAKGLLPRIVQTGYGDC